MRRFISNTTSSLTFFVLLGITLLLSEPVWSQTTTIRGGSAPNTAGVVNGLLQIQCASGCGGSGGTSQADNSAVTDITGIGALYDTTPPAITDGNVGLPVMDSSRRLIVNCGAGCSGSSFADNSAFTFGTSSVTPIAGVFDDTSTNTATENSAAVARITAQKGLHVNIRNASGTELATSGAPLRIDPTGTTTQPVSLASVPSHNVTNAGTFAVQATQSGTWTVQPGNTANTTPWLTTITQGGNTAAVNASGQLSITCANCSGSGASFVDDAAFTVGTSSGAPAMALFDDVTPDSVNEGDVGVLRMSANRVGYFQIRDAAGNERGANVNASNQLSVSVDNTVTVASHAVTNAGTFAVQAAQSGTWTVQPGNTANTTPWLVDARGNVAHDAADSGNPLKLGAKAETSISGATMVADADRTDLYAGIDGVLITRPYANLEDRVSNVVSITDGSSTQVVAAQGAGIRFCATTLIVSNSSATNVTVDIRDGTAGSVLATIPAAANMGGGVVPLLVPLCTTANTIFAADPSAAATTVAVTAVGFKTKL
jgi:hypothetical protein